MSDFIQLSGIGGCSAHRRVLLGFAPANLLHSLSFADVLDEATGRGYQRRFNPQHSLDFRKYIQKENSSTIPLTFNLRPCDDDTWRVEEISTSYLNVLIRRDAGKVLSQVDCQHRLGHLNDLDITLPFMCYLGLSELEELEIFNVINSKAKGLSSSLLDFHDATLSADLAEERPELLISLYLNDNSESPWYRQLDLGGKSTSGMMRRASLRTMQKAVKRFLAQTQILRQHSADSAARIVLDFWAAVALVLHSEWNNPRRSLITKGIGVYSLMEIAGDLYKEDLSQHPDKRYFTNKLSEFITDIDWTTKGTLKGLGGEAGAKHTVGLLRAAREKCPLRIVSNGK
ncbi:MAG TPA: DGQHR domain-containing protein [Pyrinomonadaceae bacterium]|nr:DGQHR domain-containing protein [Pyrinomonadaceae bacterium]